MTSRLLLSLAVVLMFAVSGCTDNALTDLDGSATTEQAAPASVSLVPSTASVLASASTPGEVAQKGSCSASVSGPSTLVPGTQGTYTTSPVGCGSYSVFWTISGDGTIVTSSGNSATVEAGSMPGSFTITAAISYNVDELLVVSKTVEVKPNTMTMSISNSGMGLNVYWYNTPSGATLCILRRTPTNRATGNTEFVDSWTVSGSPYFDGMFQYNKFGSYDLNYVIEVYDSGSNMIGRGEITRRGDPAF